MQRILLLTIALLAAHNAVAQERYDIVIANGRVMDPETGLDAIRDVGIRAEKVVAISEVPLAGATEIDASGLVVSPGFIDLHAHGQSAGTFSRFLGRYVRDQEILSLMAGLAKVTLMPAERLEFFAPQMKRKGRIQVGRDADITVFGADDIIDTADFEHDLSYSEGVRYVLVNDEFVVWDGELVEGARPGRAILGRYSAF